MADMIEVSTATPAELLGAGRRHLAVRDFHSAAEVLAKACELLAKEHGDTADQCAEAYLWYVCECNTKSSFYSPAEIKKN